MAFVIGRALDVLSYFVEPPIENEQTYVFLMRHPLVNGIVIAAYLFTVLKWGPEYMKNRKPYDLRAVMLTYNAVQVIFNVLLCIFCTYAILAQGHILSCTKPDVLTALCLHLYFFNKYADLLDTIIFVFRKKQNQVSFLHVYHHIAVIGGCLIALNLHKGGQVVMVFVLNCFVHSIMYAYYFISIYNKNTHSKYAFMKKRITQLQMVQFMLISAHFGRGALGICECSKFLSVTGFIQNTFVTCLFLDFYIRAYGPRSK